MPLLLEKVAFRTHANRELSNLTAWITFQVDSAIPLRFTQNDISL
jgi:hypothetical protein